MNSNFIWYSDSSKHLFYVPSDLVEQIKNKDLEKDFEKKVTKDGREIFFLKDNPLPEFIKPAFASVPEEELKILQRKVADINKSENARLGLLKIPPHLMREGVGSKLDESSKVTLAHSSTRLREMMNNSLETIKKNKELTKLAAAEGNLEILKWAINKNAPFNPRECLDLAALNGKADIIEWIFDWMTKEESSGAVTSQNDQLPVDVKKNTVISEQMGIVLEGLAKGGHVELFKSLSNKYDSIISPLFYTKPAYLAVRTGQLELLKVIYSMDFLFRMKREGFNNYPFDFSATAIDNGQLKILDWLRKNGQPIHVVHISENKYDNPEVIEWAIKNGLYIDIQTVIQDPQLRSKPKTIEWLKQRGAIPQDF